MANKPNLLEIVQEILTDISSDEVNSISDTEDSEQVAKHVRATYRALITQDKWPHTRRALTLNPRSDSAFPNYMIVKEDLKELISVYYNKAKVGEARKNYEELTYLDPDDFLMKLNKRDNTKANTDVIIDDSGIELLILNDKHPQWYTSFNDVDIVFDSYDSAVDSTLQTSKVQAQGWIIPEFRLEDTFVPDLPVDGFSLLIEESISRSQFKMRQMVDTKAEQESARQRRTQSQKNWTVSGGTRYPNYGRKR